MRGTDSVDAGAADERCGICRFYRPRNMDQAAAERARAAGVAVPEGHCRRYPQHLATPAGEWCGEFAARAG
jgi:hypothetical protein